MNPHINPAFWRPFIADVKLRADLEARRARRLVLGMGLAYVITLAVIALIIIF